MTINSVVMNACVRFVMLFVMRGGGGDEGDVHCDSFEEKKNSKDDVLRLAHHVSPAAIPRW